MDALSNIDHSAMNSAEPDFGIQNSINFEEKPCGWDIFLELVQKYPWMNRVRRLVDTITQEEDKKKIIHRLQVLKKEAHRRK